MQSTRALQNVCLQFGSAAQWLRKPMMIPRAIHLCDSEDELCTHLKSTAGFAAAAAADGNQYDKLRQNFVERTCADAVGAARLCGQLLPHQTGGGGGGIEVVTCRFAPNHSAQPSITGLSIEPRRRRRRRQQPSARCVSARRQPQPLTPRTRPTPTVAALILHLRRRRRRRRRAVGIESLIYHCEDQELMKCILGTQSGVRQSLVVSCRCHRRPSAHLRQRKE